MQNLASYLQNMTSTMNKMKSAIVDAGVNATYLDGVNEICTSFKIQVEVFIALLSNNNIVLNDQDAREDFIKQNIRKLHMLRDILVNPENIAKYNGTLQRWCRIQANRILTPLQWNATFDRWKSRVTKIFTLFCQGVTYFKIEMQQGRDPVYHRNASCGTRQLESNVKFTHWIFKDYSLLVERCLIERLVFTKLGFDLRKQISFQELRNLRCFSVHDAVETEVQVWMVKLE
jgi:hypothetical protein